jgi:hypothetical protein
MCAPHTVANAEQGRLLQAFIAAAQAGDLAAHERRLGFRGCSRVNSRDEPALLRSLDWNRRGGDTSRWVSANECFVIETTPRSPE